MARKNSFSFFESHTYITFHQLRATFRLEAQANDRCRQQKMYSRQTRQNTCRLPVFLEQSEDFLFLLLCPKSVVRKLRTFSFYDFTPFPQTTSCFVGFSATETISSIASATVVAVEFVPPSAAYMFFNAFSFDVASDFFPNFKESAFNDFTLFPIISSFFLVQLIFFCVFDVYIV
nr:MAG TPA: hypothetical protein [Caudoviricetes sp.]